METILITGGAGYIGSHFLLKMLEMDYSPIVVDNLSTGHIETIDILKKYGNFTFIPLDLKDKNAIVEIFKKYKIDTVVHFAGLSEVEQSFKRPQLYYENNVFATYNLLDVMVENNVKKIIFSSSAAIYGEAKYCPIDENHPINPINPYGESKYLIEKKLIEYDEKYNLKSVSLRYFNVVGAKWDKGVGEWHDRETHLIPNILKSNQFNLFGNDYDTPDGTCIRDYIDINDLIEAHILAIDYLNKNNQSNQFNLASKNAYSIKEILKICQDIKKEKIEILIKPKRCGDVAMLIADNKKAKEILDWNPSVSIEESINCAYRYINSFGCVQ